MATKITVIQGDITKSNAQAIVNAANTSLMGGGGVDGAIHHAGGPQILEECMVINRRVGGCPTGNAVITNAGKLKAKKIIHTVGPVWNGGKNNEEALLASCYTKSLELAMQHQLSTIAFPNISTGIYRFPKPAAATIAINTVRNFINQHPGKLDEVIFVCFDEENLHLYQSLLLAEKL